MKREHGKGFTIVELIIALVIVAILAGIAWISYKALQRRAEIAALTVTAQLMDHEGTALAAEFNLPLSSGSDADRFILDSLNKSLPGAPDLANGPWESVTTFIRRNAAGSYTLFHSTDPGRVCVVFTPQVETVGETNPPEAFVAGEFTADADGGVACGGSGAPPPPAPDLVVSYDPPHFTSGQPPGTTITPSVLTPGFSGIPTTTFDLLDDSGTTIPEDQLPGGWSGGKVEFDRTTGQFTLRVQLTDWNFTAVKVTSFGNTTCALAEDTTVHCWGANTSGLLGTGSASPVYSSSPKLVSGLVGVEQLATTDGDANHMCVVTQDKTVWCWGANGSGELGDGTTTSRFTPVQVLGLQGATSVAVSNGSTCAVLEDDSVRCWGSNYSGILGNGNSTSSNLPVFVSFLAGLPVKQMAMSNGFGVACAVLVDGSTRCWGNTSGSGSRPAPATANVVTTPTNLGANVLSIALTDVHGCAVVGDSPSASTGTVWCWGNDSVGQVGNGAAPGSSTATATGLSGVSQLAIGLYHTCATTASGAFCWGNNATPQGPGQVGDGTSVSKTVPTAVRARNGAAGNLTGVQMVSAGIGHSCAVESTGGVSCWGNNASGQVGDSSTSNRLTPASVSGAGAQVSIPVVTVVVTVVGTDMVASPATVTESVTLNMAPTLAGPGEGGFSFDYASGVFSGALPQSLTPSVAGASGSPMFLLSSARGSLPSGVSVNSTTGVLTGPAAWAWDFTPVQVATGTSHACALDNTGLVHCWGRNNAGQLGDGTTTNRTTPVVVNGLADVHSIDAGGDTTCALLGDGTAKCWGNNGAGFGAYPGVGGVLGSGQSAAAFTYSSTPLSVLNLQGIESLSVSGMIGCAVVTGGSVHCWGWPPLMGTGTSAITGVGVPSGVRPTLVVNVSDAVKVVTGGPGACALIVDGTVKCWGNGYMGNGSGYGASGTPVAVSGISNAVDLSLGAETICALLADGTVKCWGDNGWGELGIGTQVLSTTPVTVSGLTNATSVSVGGYSTCATLTGGTVKCWGNDSTGGAGLGMTAQPLKTPVSVPGLSSVSQVDLAGDFACALAGAELACWGTNTYRQAGSLATTGIVLPVFPQPDATVKVSATDADGRFDVVSPSLSVQPSVLAALSISYPDTNLSSTVLPSLSDAVASPVYTLSGVLTPGVSFTSATGSFSGTPSSAWSFTTSQLSVGISHECVVLPDTTVRCWGLGGSGRLGNNSASDQPTPVTVVKADGSPLSGVVSVAAGSDNTCATTVTGPAWCWGSDGGGRLGNGGGTTNSLVPVQVFGPLADTYWVDIDAGGSNTCGVTSTGSVYCWGAQSNGAVGNGARFVANITAPVSTGITGAVDVTVGGVDGCALLSDSTVKCWGSWWNGSTGVPFTLATDTDMTQIDGGSFYCGRTSAGLVKCWDWSGTITTVSGVTNAVKVEVSGGTACATLEDGSAKCWGTNTVGQTGAGSSSASVATPVRLTGLPEVSSAAPGSATGWAVSTDGRLFTWGNGGLPFPVQLPSTVTVSVTDPSGFRSAHTTVHLTGP